MAMALFSFFTILIAPLLHLSMAGSETDLQKVCGQNQARDGLKYMANFFNVMKTMHEEMREKRFAMREGGEYPDRIYVLSQCTNNLSGEACDACFSRISAMWGNCLSFTSGRIFLDECFMRFDNYSFFRETTSTSTDKQRICSNNTGSASKQYRESATILVNELAKKAPRNRGYAEGKKKTIEDNNLSVYGMASCLNTMDTSSCASCLANASAAVTRCLTSEEGIAFNPGCVVRYFHQPTSYKSNFVSDPKYVFEAVACLLVMFLVGIVVGTILRNKRRNCHLETQRLEINSLVTISMRFKYSTLQKATDDFDESHKIGQGGYGEVFKGALQDGREIAIKRLFLSGRNQTNTVCNEMDIICLAQHENLVRFLGSCFENGSLLVYEFVANGSLDRTLFDPEKKKGLDWKKRLGIIEGTAKGLEYLHRQCQARIIHRDIKASNILLDWKYRPKISDFGLARFYSNDRIGSNIAIAGTIGYMAPEYLAQGRLTEKVDVYSYGVLVLEIISGVENNNYHSEDVLSTLVTTTWKHFQAKTAREIIDTSIAIEDVNKVQRIIQIGLLCTQESPSLRPDIGDVVQWLEHKNLELPNPSQPPFADECLALLPDSPLVYSSFRPHERSISIDSCDADTNER